MDGKKEVNWNDEWLFTFKRTRRMHTRDGRTTGRTLLAQGPGGRAATKVYTDLNEARTKLALLPRQEARGEREPHIDIGRDPERAVPSDAYEISPVPIDASDADWNAMSHISLQTAIDIAEKYLNDEVRNSHDLPESDRWVITDNIYDCGSHWLFHYQSELHLRTGNPSYLLAGNMPLRVSKSTGEILGFGSM